MKTAQPQNIFEAKGMARKLREAFARKGASITASESLETLAFICGLKDWNTLSGKLKQDEGTKQNAIEVLAQEMGLYEEDLNVGYMKCRNVIFANASLDIPGNDFWKMRAESYLQAVFFGVRFWCQKKSVTSTPQMIRSALAFGTGRDFEKLNRGGADTEFSFLDLYRWMLSQNIETEEAFLRMKGIIDTTPGFSLASLHAGTDQSLKTKEQVGFLTMQLTKPLGDLVDHAEERDAA